MAGLGNEGGLLRVDLRALAAGGAGGRGAPARPRARVSPPAPSGADSLGPSATPEPSATEPSGSASGDSEDDEEGGASGVLSALQRRFAEGGETEQGASPDEEDPGDGEEKPSEDWMTWKAVAGLPEAMSAEAAAAADRAREEALRKAEERRRNAGPGWHDIPERELTPEQRRELKLLKLRGAMDPKQHYRAADSSKLPTRFHFGTVIEGPSEFYSGRLTRKERRANFTQEVLGDDAVKAYAKRKFRSINEEAAAKAGARYRGGLARHKKKRKSNHKGWKG